MIPPCAIGTLDPTTGHFRGRYVDQDGDPTVQGPALAALITAAHGDLAAVLDVVVRDHLDWSILTGPLTPGRPEPPIPNRHMVAVPGYGVAFPAHITPDSHFDWVEATAGDPDSPAVDVHWIYGFTGTDLATARLLVLDRSCALRLDVPVAALDTLPAGFWHTVEHGTTPPPYPTPPTTSKAPR